MLRLAWIILSALVALLAGAAIPQPSSPSPAVVIDCKDRTDGFYVVGCSKNFTECHKGTAHKKHCPSHLFFSSKLGRCEIVSEISECKNPKTTEGKIFASPPEFSCKNKTDGFYSHPSLPCDKTYYVCLKENVMRMACGYQQFFDVKSNRCEFKSRVPACKGIKIAGANMPNNNAYGQPSEPLSMDGPMPPAPPSETDGSINLSTSDSPPDCSNKEDGVYTDEKVKCANFFYKCAHKKLFKYACQKGLFYDIEAVRCDHKQFVPNCGGVRQMTTAAPATQPALDAPTDFDCAGKSDGIQTKQPCSSEFYTCLGGIAVKQICNDGLVFDSRVGHCDYPLACQQERTTTPRPPPAEVVNALQADYPKLPAPTQPAINFDCQKNGDGHHQLGKCQKNFITCSNGQAMQHSCPADLVYNGQQCDYLAGCLSPPSTTTQTPLLPQSPQQPASQNPYGNQLQSQPTTSSSSQALPPAPPPATLPLRDQSSAPVGQINCSGLPNGAHATAQCSQSYVECWNGRSQQSECQHGLFFNPYGGYCDYPGSIEGCGGQAPASSPTQGLPSQQNNGLNQQQAQPSQTPLFQSQPFQRQSGGYNQPAQSPPSQGPSPQAPSSETNKCAGLSNGKYAEGCSSVFYTCIYGQTYKTDCPTGLFYDRERDMCDVKTVVRACGGHPQQPQQPQQTPPQQPLQPQQPYQQQSSQPSQPSWDSQSSQPQSTWNTQAQNRRLSSNSIIPGAEANPIYGQGATASDAVNQVGTECTEESVKNPGCKPYYFRCLNGRLDRVFCAPGQYYDLANHKCDRMNKILACGGSPATPANDPASQGPVSLPEPSGADTFCADKDTGFHGVGCNTYGYACVSGSTLKFNCPPGTHFDTETNKCDWKEHITACGGSSPVSTTPSPQPEAPMLPVVEGANAADAPQLPQFCEKMATGLYGDGCNSHFYYCNNGMTQKLSCPSGTFYHIAKKNCLLKSDVPACQPQTIAQSPPAPTAAPTSGSWSPYSQLASPAPSARHAWSPNVQSAPPAPISGAEDFDCSTKEDGLFALSECSPIFIQCYSKQKVQQKCQTGLFYNQANGLCDYPDKVCGSSQTTSAAPPAAPQTPQPTQPAQPSSVSDAARPNVRPYPAVLQSAQADKPIDASCAGKQDGYYAHGCSQTYYSCIHGVLHQHKCQPLLAFNEDEAFCDYEQAVPACQSSTSSGSSDNSNSVSSDVPQGPVPPSQSTSAVPKIETLPTFSCRGKPDGDYRLFPCSRNYITCTRGKYDLKACQIEQRFDGNTRRCEVRSKISTCEQLPENNIQQQQGQGQPQGSTEGSSRRRPEVASPPAPPVDQSQPQGESQSSSTSTSSDFCRGKEDGFYNAEDCSSNYFSCSGQVAHPGLCPHNLIYNIASGLCDYSLNVPGCGTAPSQPTQPSIQQSPPAQNQWNKQGQQGQEQNQWNPSSSSQQSSWTPQATQQSGQQNYNQQQPQQPQSSQPLQTVQPVQPSVPVQQQQQGQSSQPSQNQWSPNVAPQLPVQPSEPTQQLPTRADYNGQQPLTPQAQTQPQQLENFSCNGQADGIYGAKCMAVYFKCSGGVTFQQKCNPGSVFDGVSGGCDFPAKVGCQ